MFVNCFICLLLSQIASLPHVELEFVVPGRPNTRHKSLFLVDSGEGPWLVTCEVAGLVAHLLLAGSCWLTCASRCTLKAAADV
jgi:hypothetical protein